MKKTIREWFLNELPYEMGQEALKMCDCPDEQVSCLSTAIKWGFHWGNSPSGFRYWCGVYDGLRAVGK